MHEHARSKTMTPSESVFQTFELLEEILFHLPTKMLLLSQRVNKRWKSTIDASTKLQQALFLQPIPGNPIMFREPTISRRTLVESKYSMTTKCVINPLLCDIFDALKQKLELSDSPIQYALLKRFGRGNGVVPSWTRMLPSQPPVRNCIYLECLCEYAWNWLHDRPYACTDELRYEQGQNMLDIITGLDRKMAEADQKHVTGVKICCAPALHFGDWLRTNDQLEDLIRHRRVRMSRNPTRHQLQKMTMEEILSGCVQSIDEGLEMCGCWAEVVVQEEQLVYSRDLKSNEELTEMMEYAKAKKGEGK